MLIDDTPTGRGKRLKFLRKLADLTSAELAELSGLSRASISIWENALTRGLTKKGAEQVLDALKEKNIDCDINWLWFGIGEEPLSNTKKLSTQPLKTRSDKNHSVIINNPYFQEIQLFLSTYRNSEILEINSSCMMPFFLKGDIVGGIWKEKFLANDYNICIVEIDGILEARKVSLSISDGRYDISFITVCEEEPKPYRIDGIKLQRIAPIRRVWR